MAHSEMSIENIARYGLGNREVSEAGLDVFTFGQLLFTKYNLTITYNTYQDNGQEMLAAQVYIAAS